MEVPSLYLAQEQLKPFKKRVVRTVSGNTTKIDIARLENQTVRDIFSWGKHLVFQFDAFAIRVHFLLFGTFAAEIDGTWVTGDYKKARVPRLKMDFENGTVELYNCSIKLEEEIHFKKQYDYSIDIMSKKWDGKAAFINMAKNKDEEISDVLLDQTIFAGVGNIIKNEVLSIVKVNPKTLLIDLSPKKLHDIIAETQAFSLQFYRWRKKFVLRKNLKAHRKGTCPRCGTKMIREKTGKRDRWAYWCPVCQPL